jgi:hypothetical protein
MPDLIPPEIYVHRSFLAAMTEFRAEGRGGPGEDGVTGREIREYTHLWEEPAEFARYVRGLRDDALEESGRHSSHTAARPASQVSAGTIRASTVTADP